ncbi:unnamed protein product [Absidia cylindrospora]
MPTSFHSRRGSAQQQHPPSLPYHRSKFYKPAKVIYQQQQQQQRRRRWALRLVILTIAIIGCRYLFFASSTTTSPPPLHFPELTIAQQYQPTPVTAATIPNIVHFVYGLKAPNPSLNLIHYLAIKSAHDRLQPDTIMFHYHYLPTGDLFDQALPMLTLHQVDLVPTVFDRPVTHFAHQADIIRLEMLRQYGGIYLDLDVIVMAPMDNLLNQHEFIMGQEGVDGSVGLCNAVILAKPNARFLQRWQATYRTFDQTDWNYHSVVLPGQLAPAFNTELTILNHTAFFWPLWDSPGLRTLFLEKSYDFSLNYASHIWESAANPHLMAGLSVDVIQHIDNSLYCQLRLLLPDQTKVRPCRRLVHSTLPDQLVGYWPLTTPDDNVLRTINPTPATDHSGNDMHGIIRNGYYGTGNDGVYVSGQDSYVFLSMPNNMTMDHLTVQWDMKLKDDKQGGVVMMVQTDIGKLMIKTQGVVELWSLALDGWTWHLNTSIPTTTTTFVQDDQYHTFTLVLGNTGSLLVPHLVLYMDGSVVAAAAAAASSSSVVVRGIWFGSAEPPKYQDPWDTRPSVAAWYKHLRVWERPLTIDAIRAMAYTNDNQQQQKDWQVDDNNTTPKTHDNVDDGSDLGWKDDDGLDESVVLL